VGCAGGEQVIDALGGSDLADIVTLANAIFDRVQLLDDGRAGEQLQLFALLIRKRAEGLIERRLAVSQVAGGPEFSSNSDNFPKIC
jgi:hypothetical protein